MEKRVEFCGLRGNVTLFGKRRYDPAVYGSSPRIRLASAAFPDLTLEVSAVYGPSTLGALAGVKTAAT
jgi:hypothetical protein